MLTITPTETIWGHGIGLSSGQREPQYELLTPFESMPEKMTGRTVWTKEDLEKNESHWIRPFSPEEVLHIEAAIKDAESKNLQLSEIDQSSFPLPPEFKASLAEVRDELINGIGFCVLRGLPVRSWTTRQASIAYLGLGSYIGRRISQNRHGHMLGHVKDLEEGKEVNGEGRLYRTHQAQTFHSDESDIVGLLCLRQAMEGGESQVVSTHNIYNVLRRERPDILRQMCQVQWFYDRKGEINDGEKEWMNTPGYYYYKGKLSMKWDSYYVGALQRFWEAGLLPQYTDAQREAIRVMEDTCHRLCLEMTLQCGDIQFVTNTHNLHARSAYKDDNNIDEKRWLQRLWLATCEEEGGWPLPFADSCYNKRGGVQVNLTPESYPLEAE
ncbi:Taurine hydroxylase-like protein SAT17 [Penicillium macrosclerotiorum]|uniref:Taurine hydroxylase-like protein SAT17 n=1 Tax=Penicillium macrosclerotiorum TaxID=303699 RepID=UPI0025486C82|nr:Taurine hydroxylase-like protein SAT17 [Penicillium macrosclerotiorum]KAJ5669537.1 Taurine hydroxylase-like protein SAT17 [Penicillium macrosclerotiorum]